MINRTWRKAISLAFDYDYLINTIRRGHCSRMTSVVPDSIVYGNSSMDAFDTDLVLARRAMQEMGFGIGFNVNDDAEWQLQAMTFPFRTLNYTYNIGNALREDVLVLLSDSLRKIGCAVLDAGTTWAEVLYRLYELAGHNRDELELWWIGWGPDYNDPMNFINPLFTNRTVASNGAQYNGWWAAREARLDPNYTTPVNERNLWDNVQLLMEAAISETNPKTRKQMFWRMQELLVERDYPWVFGFNTIEVDAFDSSLKGMITEAMRNPYFYPCYWEDFSMVISSPSDITYELGDTGHSISWTITADFVEDPTYYIYENNILIDSGIWVSGSPIVKNVDGLPVGVTQYRIEAHNSDEVAEDIVLVTVTPKEEAPEIPGYSLIFLIGTVIFALLYMFKKMGKKVK